MTTARGVPVLVVLAVVVGAATTTTSATGPALIDDLELSRSQVVQVSAAYLVSFSGLLLLGGRIADVFGRRRVVVTGLWVFAVGSLGAGLAPDATALLGARVVQGVGAALALPGAMALIDAVVPDGPRRERALAVWGGLGGLGAGAGILLGALAVNGLSWRFAFATLAVIAASTATAARRTLPSVPPDRRPLDGAGGAAVTIAIAAISGALVLVGEGAGPPAVTTAALAGAGALALFVAIERATAFPIVAVGALRDRRRVVGLVTATLPPAAGAATALLLSFQFADVLGWSSLRSAAGFIPYIVALAAGSATSGPLLARLHPTRTLVLGLWTMAGGAMLLAQMSVDDTYLGVILAGLVVLQFGAGVAVGASVVLCTHRPTSVPDRSSSMSGLLNTALALGGTIGVTVFGMIASRRTDAVAHLPTATAVTMGTTSAFAAAAWVFGLAGLAVIVALGPRSRRRPPVVARPVHRFGASSAQPDAG